MNTKPAVSAVDSTERWKPAKPISPLASAVTKVQPAPIAAPSVGVKNPP